MKLRFDSQVDVDATNNRATARRAMRNLLKFISTLLAGVVLSGCGVKQTTSASAPVPAPEKLSDSYATSALLALKAIQRDPLVQPKNSNLVSRATQEKIDAADVAAVSEDEKKLTAVLNVIYNDQLSLNRQNNEVDKMTQWTLNVDATQYTQKQWNKIIDAQQKVILAGLPARKTLKAHLDSCFADFDTSLRARSTTAPTSCTTEK
jgi:hypothetical protein